MRAGVGPYRERRACRPVSPPMPLLLPPVPPPVAGAFGVLLLRAVDHFLRVERQAARDRPLLRRLRLGNDEHHQDIPEHGGAFGDDAASTKPMRMSAASRPK